EVDEPAAIPSEIRRDDREATGAVAVVAPPPTQRPPIMPPGPAEAAPNRAARVDSERIMVPAARLDALVRLVGESAAANLGVGRMLAERLSVDPAAAAEF